MRIVVVIILSVVISSCASLRKVPEAPEYVNDTTDRKALITNEVIPLPHDTSKTIIVYNVIEKDDNKFKLTDETVRLLIADFFGTLTTVITVWQMQSQNP